MSAASAPQPRHAMTRPSRISRTFPGVVEARGSENRRRRAGAGCPLAVPPAVTVPVAGPPVAGPPPVTVAVISDPPCRSPSSELTNHDVYHLARTRGVHWVNAHRRDEV